MEGWILAAVAAVLGVVGVLLLRARGKAPGAAPPQLQPQPQPSPQPDAGPTPTPEPSPEPTPSPASSAPASEPAPAPTAVGLPAATLQPIAPFQPAAVSGGLLAAAVEAGQFEEPTWIEIEWDGLLVEVGAHALRARVGEKILRLPVTWLDTLAICKRLDWCPPTAPLVDAVWAAATVRVAPVPMGNFSTPEKAKATSKKMLLLEYSAAHNANVDAAIPPDRLQELCATEGKDWILSKRNLTTPTAATTYGWHQANGKPIQGLGPDEKPPAHDHAHFDQTQVLRPIRRRARRKSDGAPVDLCDELESRGLPAACLKALRP